MGQSKYEHILSLSLEKILEAMSLGLQKDGRISGEDLADISKLFQQLDHTSPLVLAK